MLVKAHLTYQDMDLRLYNSQNISAPFLRIDDAYFLSSPMKEVSFLQSFQALKRHRLGMSNNFGIKFFTPDLHLKKILLNAFKKNPHFSRVQNVNYFHILHVF